jgi:hypothetical protein
MAEPIAWRLRDSQLAYRLMDRFTDYSFSELSIFKLVFGNHPTWMQTAQFLHKVLSARSLRSAQRMIAQTSARIILLVVVESIWRE